MLTLIIFIALWLGAGFGCWLMVMASHPNDRGRIGAYLLVPVVLIAWPVLVYESWENSPFA